MDDNLPQSLQTRLLSLRKICKEISDTHAHSGVHNELSKLINLLIALIEEVERNENQSISRPASSSRIQGLLEQIQGGLRAVVWEDTACLEEITGLILHLLWRQQWPPKHRKVIIKILSELERQDQEIAYRQQEKYTQGWSLDKEALNKWSCMLESCPVVQRLTRERLGELLERLAILMRETCCISTWTPHHQQMLQTLAKVCMQLLQHLSDSFRQIVYTQPTCSHITPHQHSSLEDIFSSLVCVLQMKSWATDCVLLSGTCISFLLALDPQVDRAMRTCLAIHSYVGKFEKLPLSIGHVRIDPYSLYSEQYEEQEAADDTQMMGQLAVIRGLLSCAKPDLLCVRLPPPDHHSHIVTWIFQAICDLCRGQHQYHAFQLLIQWYRKVSASLDCIEAECGEVFSGEGSVVQPSMEIVWTHLDSPVEGVNSAVIEVFECLLEQCVSKDDMIIDLTQKVLSMSWHVKGKHSLLAVLLRHISIDKFLCDSGEIFDALLDCASTNYLSPTATQLYKAIIQALLKQMRTRDEVMEQFTQHCMQPIISGLGSSKTLLRHNVNSLWLPWTLRLLPEVYEHMVKWLQQELTTANQDTTGELLHALIALHKTARTHRLLKTLPTECLQQALYHPDDDLRLDAFTLICVTSKKSESLQEDELELLRLGLVHSMNVDSAPFRQQLQTCIRSVLVRVRDGSLSLIRTSNREQLQSGNIPPQLHLQIGFVDWLWTMCVSNLCLAYSYQRLKTSLDIIVTVLETFTYQEHRTQKKGGTPETVVQLLSVAQGQGMLNFFSQQSTHAVISCILHGTDEIRELAGEVVLQYFPWPLSLRSGYASQLLGSAVSLSHSAKNCEAQAGALITYIIFKKIVIEGNDIFVISREQDGYIVTSPPISSRDDVLPSVHFIRQLIDLIDINIQEGHSNALAAAKHSPAHGIIQTVRRCLSECSSMPAELSQWRSMVERLIELITDMIDLVLVILGGKVQDDESAPSFEQMGQSIQAAILESTEEGGYQEDTVLSAEHQLIMTWCWINIKESSILLGSLVKWAVVSGGGRGTLLTVEHVTTISQIFMRVLTKCRHRGAIEGCNVGFQIFCTALLMCSDPQLHAIPSQIIHKVLDEVRSVTMKASITRRSAGLPLIVQSIVASESKAKQSRLLVQVISGLLAILEEALPPDHDQQHDIPQVHAMNILRSVFRESSVAMATMPYQATTVMHAIQGFSSPFWAVRNGAIQLFGTLIQRMLGQKKTKDDRLNTVTVPEFFTHYPVLQDFLLQQMMDAARDHLEGGLKLHPSLFPVLAILSKLSPGVHMQNNHSLSQFELAVSSLASSAIYSVRELAAKALVPLISPEDATRSLQAIIEDLPSSPEGATDYNRLHGCLLQVEKLQNHLRKRMGAADLMTCCEVLLRRSWLASSDNRCHLVRAKYMQLVLILSDTLEQPIPSNIEQDLQKQVESLMSSQEDQSIKIGSDRLSEILLAWWLGRAPSSPDSRLVACLRCSQPNVLQAALTFLKTVTTSTSFSTTFWTQMQETLCERISGGLPRSALCEAMELVIATYEVHGVCCGSHQVAALWDVLMALIRQEANARAGCLAVTISAILIHQYCENLRDKLVEWSEQLVLFTDVFRAEGLRLQAAVALQIAGVTLLEEAQLPTGHFSISMRVFEAGHTLLQDDQPLVRKHAAAFVHSLTTREQKFAALHSSVALEMLCQYFCNKFGHQEEFIMYFFKLLYIKDNISNIIKQQIGKQTEELFEPEEVNAYKEEVILLDMLSRHLQEHLISRTSLDVTEIDNMVSQLCQQLQAVTPVLDMHCSGVGPLNVTCSRRVLETMWKVLLVAQYLGSVVVKGKLCTSPHRVTVMNALVPLSEVPYLHPVLQSQVDRSIKCWTSTH